METDEVLNNFEIAVKEVHKKADNISTYIKRTESLLRENKIRMPFSIVIKEDGPKKYCLSWNYYAKNDDFRLLFIVDGEGTIKIRKPFIETSIDMRFEFGEFLPDFMELYTQRIRDKYEPR